MKPILKIEEIRLANLQSLIIEFGTAAEVGRLSDTSRIYLSQILTRASNNVTGKTREIGTKLARKLEQGCRKPEGWMDINHQNLNSNEAELQTIYAAMDEPMRDLLIQQARLMMQMKK